MYQQGGTTHSAMGCGLGGRAPRLAVTDHLQDQLACQHLHGHSRSAHTLSPPRWEAEGTCHRAGLGVTGGRSTSSFPGGGLGCAQDTSCAECLQQAVGTWLGGWRGPGQGLGDGSVSALHSSRLLFLPPMAWQSQARGAGWRPKVSRPAFLQ